MEQAPPLHIIEDAEQSVADAMERGGQDPQSVALTLRKILGDDCYFHLAEKRRLEHILSMLTVLHDNPEYFT